MTSLAAQISLDADNFETLYCIFAQMYYDVNGTWREISQIVVCNNVEIATGIFLNLTCIDSNLHNSSQLFTVIIREEKP